VVELPGINPSSSGGQSKILGAAVGVLVGDATGAVVGDATGAVVGDATGATVGAVVGGATNGVGAEVGLDVTVTTGAAVGSGGDKEGVCVVGKVVGFSVRTGAVVGKKVGNGDGGTTTLVVGRTVVVVATGTLEGDCVGVPHWSVGSCGLTLGAQLPVHVSRQA
jgi:hypothetical protein